MSEEKWCLNPSKECKRIANICKKCKTNDCNSFTSQMQYCEKIEDPCKSSHGLKQCEYFNEKGVMKIKLTKLI